MECSWFNTITLNGKFLFWRSNTSLSFIFFGKQKFFITDASKLSVNFRRPSFFVEYICKNQCIGRSRIEVFFYLLQLIMDNSLPVLAHTHHYLVRYQSRFDRPLIMAWHSHMQSFFHESLWVALKMVLFWFVPTDVNSIQSITCLCCSSCAIKYRGSYFRIFFINIFNTHYSFVSNYYHLEQHSVNPHWCRFRLLHKSFTLGSSEFMMIAWFVLWLSLNCRRNNYPVILRR